MKSLTVVALTTGIFFLIISCAYSPMENSSQDDNQQSGITVMKSGEQRDLSPDASDEDIQKLVGGNTEFCLNLYQKLAQNSGNLFYSPYSISSAFAMTYAGAKAETETQIKTTLCFPFDQEKFHPAFNALDLALNADLGETTLRIVNSMWGQTGYPFVLKYLDVLALHYGAGMNLLDFYGNTEDSRLCINDWVARQTEDKIKDLIPQGTITFQTKLVLTNAIYFYSQWHYCFNEKLTADRDFTLLDGSIIKVPVMALTKDDSSVVLPYTKTGNCEAVELFYKGKRLSMVILLPAKNKFAEFETALNSTTLNQILNSLAKEFYNVKLPKFVYTSNSISLTKVLSEMGMPVAFQEGFADFSGINVSKFLYIKDVLHKAYISVDEKGTEAAGATAIVLNDWNSKPIFDVNRPFIFLIRDTKTGSILFIGKIVNPLG